MACLSGTVEVASVPDPCVPAARASGRRLGPGPAPPGCPGFGERERPQGSLPKFRFGEMLVGADGVWEAARFFLMGGTDSPRWFQI